MAESIKWLYYDIKQARFVDDDNPEFYLSSNPNSVLVEVHVDQSNVLPSGTGVGLIPVSFPALVRTDGVLYELTISGNNIIISSSGVTVEEGFLPLDGGVMVGDLILDHDPIINLEAATKKYVDNENGLLEGLLNTVSGSVEELRELAQADLTLGTDLLVINPELVLLASNQILVGSGFVINSNNITIKDPGLYEVVWSVCSDLTGSTGSARRRNLIAELNRNSGTIIRATRGGSYSRDRNSSPIGQATGSYVIQTTSNNETVGLRTEDFSTHSSAGITFETDGGYLRVRLIRRD